MIELKTPKEIEAMKPAGRFVGGILRDLKEFTKVGTNLLEIDEFVHKRIVDRKGASSCYVDYAPDFGTGPFAHYICTSVNDVVCHGIPSEREILRDGDIVNVDVSTILDGYYSDASRMFLIGNVSPERRRLVEVTRECLRIGMEAARPFGFVGDIGHAIQRHAEKNGYSVVRELCGHGVGLAFHEEPDIEHFGRRGTGMVLVPGMVFTIEPMINMGSRSIFIDEADGWTVLTDDGLPSAQWEYTFVMTESGPEILTY